MPCKFTSVEKAHVVTRLSTRQNFFALEAQLLFATGFCCRTHLVESDTLVEIRSAPGRGEGKPVADL